MTAVVQATAPIVTGMVQSGFLVRLVRRPMGAIGLGMLVIAVVVAVLAPVLAPYDPDANVHVGIEDVYQTPSAAHLLGTDDGGNDVLSALIFGARVSLVVGFAASLMTILIGGTIGLVAGYRGGWLSTVLMRFTDFVLVIPDLALQIVIVAILGPSLLNIILVIGGLGWTSTARLVRSQTLSVRERMFVTRARAIGAGDLHIVWRHVLPQILPLMLATMVLAVSLAILAESSLAFIGLGDPTVISWGQMLNFAFSLGAVSAGAWWALLPPGFAIVWVVLGTTLLGTALEDVLNPRLKRHHLERDRSVRVAEPEGMGWLRVEPVRADAPLLRVRGLTVEFDSPAGPLRAVHDASFELRRGETLGLVGESACGKTTTVLGLLRLLPPGGRVTAGQVLFDGEDLMALPERDLRAVRGKRLAIVFQGAMNALNPVRRVGDQVAEVIRIHEPEVGARVADRRARVLLERVGIGGGRYADYPHQYSGGMRQRAMIAMALACRPDVIVADEPTTALDVMIQAQILELLAGLAREFGMATILVTHDLGVVAQVCDRVVVMYGGRVVEDAPTLRLFADPQHPYTRLLLASFPDLLHPERPLQSIPGSPPRLDAMPPGCPFAPRCPAAFDRCSTVKPPAYDLGDGRRAACLLVEPGHRAPEPIHA
ncbi:MAG TPA: dipeptide/oligopeptide/nickel ABC transporter permease/ATP-binding protein [Candidatus Limnocylindria bacterium]|nr:dipeptide/oligopeptide/nickel ABC transporter permease/ATP-binding protein [Candidatus Limnocylindria bacterium]